VPVACHDASITIDMSIEITHLTKSYDGKKAVDDISFSVKKGEITGFLGPNGAGKSTTLKMIAGYLKPNSGDIRVCGIPVWDNAMPAKSRMGYLPELNPLYPDMYVREYLGFIAGVHGMGDAKARISEIIEMTGLTPAAAGKIEVLSKGYKQRVGLAAALLHDPEVLILDEPTSGFDPNQIAEIREVIRSLGQTKTILFSSHILQEVEALCERAIIIHQGRIVADDRISILQAESGSKRLKVTFREQIQTSTLESLTGVESLKSEDLQTWTIQTGDTDALSKQLMELSLQQSLNIVSLQTESGSLEEIFRSLTASKA
jgi:ABC-2 type transport system ATP-binding protein